MTLPDKYEDWRLPDWLTDGSDIDPEKVGRAIFNSRKEEERLKAKVAEKDAEIEAKQTELDEEKARKADPDADAQQELKDLRKENRTLKEAAGQPDPSHQAELDRLNDVIDLVDKGLPKALAVRVRGDDSEARLADAKELAEAAGVDFGDESGGDPAGEGGEGGEKSGPPSNAPQSRLRTGFGRGDAAEPSNPAKAAEKLPPLFA